MIVRTAKSRLIASALAMTLLAGCGNDKGATRGADALKELAGLARAKMTKSEVTPVAAPDPVAMISNALVQIPDQPLHFVLSDKTGAFAISSVYGRNGDYVTWITPDKRTMTLNRGVLTATRGFSADLNSVEDGGAVHLITSRQSGTANRTHRFLTSSENVARLDLRCEIKRGAPAQVDSGVISAQTVLMTEDCTSSGKSLFSNSYWVDAQGRVIQSVQWINGTAGRVVFRKLRH